MALGSREILLVIRARDEASRALRGLGTVMRGLGNEQTEMASKYRAAGAALTTMGAGLSTAGIAALAFFNDTLQAATRYDQAAAKALTQTDSVKTSLTELKEIGRDVAREIPAPFEQMQEALYDIFSSMDVSVPEAKMLLTEFSKAAVAGQVNLGEAARGTIGILNAYHMPASKVNHVNDVMFQLVRKGVGTYRQFADTIGRAVPSAVRAGQSMEDLSGMLAFLTRNGLSAAMASSSAARALDALSNPKTVKKMSNLGATMIKALGEKRAKELGFTADEMFRVTDASGKFLPVSDIMTRLGKSVKNLNTDELATFMYELFKGSGGTIQARRFFDIAIRNFDQLGELTGQMHNSAGVMKGAYDIMFKQPQSQVQLLTNQYEAMKTEIGDALMPAKMRLVQVGLSLMKMWDQLSPAQQKQITQAVALTAALVTLAGFVAVAVGGFLLFAGAAGLAGIGLGVLVGIIAGVTVAVAALAAGAYIIYRNWGTIGPWLSALWENVKTTAINAWNAIVSFMEPVVTQIWTFIQEMGNIIKEVWDKIWPPFVTQFKEAWDSIVSAIGPAIQKIVEQWQAWQHAAKPLQDALVMVAKIIGVVLIGGAIAILVTAIGAIIIAFRTVASVVGTVIDVIAAVLANIIQVAQGFIEFFSGVFTGNWSLAWEGVKDIVTGTLGAIGQLLWGAVRTLGAIAWGIVQGIADWFQWLYEVTGGPDGFIGKAILGIVSWFASLPGKVAGILSSWIAAVVGFFQNLYDILVGNSVVPDMINAIVKWFAGLPGKVAEILLRLVGRAVSFFTDLKDKAVAKIREMATNVVESIRSFVETAISKYENFKQRAYLKFYEVKAKLKAIMEETKTAIITKVTDFVTKAIAKIKEMPGKAGRALADLPGIVKEKATKAFTDFIDAAKRKWESITGWLRGRPQAVKSAIGNINLYSIGSAALQSLYNGIMNKWQSVKNLVGGMGQWIKDHKGPISYDRRLLIDNGRALMQGLIAGLKHMMPELTRTVGDVTSLVATAGNASSGGPDWGSFKKPGGPGHPGTGGGWYTASTPTTPAVQVTVNTEEINPVKHAADLGWEVARRLGV